MKFLCCGLDTMFRGEEVKVDKDTGNPSKAWERMRVHQQYIVCPHPLPTDPVPDDKIRFVCISDTHGKFEGSGDSLPPGDVLLHAGDFTMKGQLREIEKFDSYLGSLPYKVKVVIAGNHDIIFDDTIDELLLNGFGLRKSAIESYLSARGFKSVKEMLTNAIYLQDSSVTVCGIKIYGAPWQPVFCDWGFNLSRGEDLLEKWKKIPTKTDILITHGPPVVIYVWVWQDGNGKWSPKHFSRMAFQVRRGKEFIEKWEKIPNETDILMTHTPACGHGDLTGGNNNVGCVELLNTIQKRVKPKYHVFGHIHEGYGVTSDGLTTFINASTCNRRYRPLNPPVVFDFTIPDGHNKEELLHVEKNSL